MYSVTFFYVETPEQKAQCRYRSVENVYEAMQDSFVQKSPTLRSILEELRQLNQNVKNALHCEVEEELASKILYIYIYEIINFFIFLATN